MKGREGDLWFRNLNALGLDEHLRTVSSKGFKAVYVDRRGFADGGVQLEAALAARLGPPRLQSADGHLALYIFGGDVAASLTREQADRSLAAGIDFSLPSWPAYVAGTSGISQAEPWGRWTDGPVALIRFAQPLPRHFVLELVVAHAYGPNRGAPVRVVAGNSERTFIVSRDGETVQLLFIMAADADTLEFRIPHPTSPSGGASAPDLRKLGIRFKQLRILPAPDDPSKRG